MQMYDDIWVWAMSPTKFVHKSMKYVNVYLKENLIKHWKIPKRADNHIDVPLPVILLPVLDQYSDMDGLPW